MGKTIDGFWHCRALQLSGMTLAKTDADQVRHLMKQWRPFSGAPPSRSQQRGAAASRRRYDPKERKCVHKPIKGILFCFQTFFSLYSCVRVGRIIE